MKKLLLLALLVPVMALAQEKKTQRYTVHEDQVRPGMVEEYRKVLYELVGLMKEHQINETRWLTIASNDYRYWYVSPVNAMADLDRNIFKTLDEKVGEDRMNDLWTRMNKCYDKHGTFMITLDKDLSYQPGGIDQNPEGQYWRKFQFWYFTPENGEAVAAKAREIKTLMEAKKSPMSYRVYRSGFGVVGAYYLVAFAAPSAVSYYSTLDITRQLMGDELSKLLGELRDLCSGYEEKEGQILTDGSYLPAVPSEE